MEKRYRNKIIIIIIIIVIIIVIIIRDRSALPALTCTVIPALDKSGR